MWFSLYRFLTHQKYSTLLLQNHTSVERIKEWGTFIHNSWIFPHVCIFLLEIDRGDRLKNDKMMPTYMIKVHSFF